MSNRRLAIEVIKSSTEWDKLVAKSPQGTLFSAQSYLESTGRRFENLIVTQGDDIKAGVTTLLSDDGRRCEADDLVIYGGILFTLNPDRSAVKRRYDEFELSEFIIDYLSSRFESIEMPMSPALLDLRPVQWHAYHGAAFEQFTLELRYTSYVDISELKTAVGHEQATSCFNSMETVRRYSVREAIRKGGTVRRTEGIEKMLAYYRDLMDRQGHPQAQSRLEGIKCVAEHLLKRDRAAIYEVNNAAGEVVYTLLYGWDEKRAYYLLGAGHPSVNEPWQGTLGHWEAFKDLAQRVGIGEVDLEGVNSPRRGWFKLGLGGDLRPYYLIRKGLR